MSMHISRRLYNLRCRSTRLPFWARGSLLIDRGAQNAGQLKGSTNNSHLRCTCAVWAGADIDIRQRPAPSKPMAMAQLEGASGPCACVGGFSEAIPPCDFPSRGPLPIRARGIAGARPSCTEHRAGYRSGARARMHTKYPELE